VALAERETGRNRKVIAIIGDGSFQYSIQALWTAVQHNLPVLFIVPRNSEYATLKSFANQEKTRGVPGLDLPGLQTAVLAQGYGCEAVRVTKPEELKAALEKNMANLVPTVLEVLITADVPPLLK
jgi:benzoylformate decarboxylase